MGIPRGKNKERKKKNGESFNNPQRFVVFPFRPGGRFPPTRYKRDEFRANSKDEIRPEAALISFVPRSQYCDERRTLIFPVPRTETGRERGKGEEGKILQNTMDDNEPVVALRI